MAAGVRTRDSERTYLRWANEFSGVLGNRKRTGSVHRPRRRSNRADSTPRQIGARFHDFDDTHAVNFGSPSRVRVQRRFKRVFFFLRRVISRRNDRSTPSSGSVDSPRPSAFLQNSPFAFASGTKWIPARCPIALIPRDAGFLLDIARKRPMWIDHELQVIKLTNHRWVFINHEETSQL